MKKFAILGLLVLAFTGFAFASHDPDDTLVVKAKISAVFDVVVTDALYGTTPLELLETGDTDKAVGSLTVNTNSRYWKLKVTATDNANLKATDGSDTYTIPFALKLRGNETGNNWADDAVVLDSTTYGDWGTAGVFSSVFNKRTTPGNTDGLDIEISYQDAATNGANWVAQKSSDGTDLVYEATVVITAMAG